LKIQEYLKQVKEIK